MLLTLTALKFTKTLLGGINLLRANSRRSGAGCGICSMLTMKTPERLR